MNIQKLREHFKNYRRQIAELNEALENQYYSSEESCRLVSKRAEACRRECEERARQEESDRWYREDQLRRATSDLERAISYNDEYAIRRATDNLKKIQ